MIRPVAFNYNVQTAVNNHYQNANDFNNNSNQINLRAQAEFDNFVLKLRSFGVEVIVFQDDEKFDTPDSVFPNNWISFHSNGDIALYPMFAENRRNERREDVVKYIEKNNYSIRNVIDLCIRGYNLDVKTAHSWGLISEIASIENIDSVISKWLNDVPSISPKAFHNG